jgi:hypothetical protein
LLRQTDVMRQMSSRCNQGSRIRPVLIWECRRGACIPAL